MPTGHFVVEKLAFALVIITCKLKPYFQAHTVIVLTDKPLRHAISNPEVAKRLALWAIELSEFDIQYRLCTTIKGQVVTNFITEFTNGEGQGADKHPQWSIDELSNKQVSGAGIALHSLERDKIECMVRLNFPTTNNEAGYEVLVVGLDLAKAVGATSMVIHCDS